MFEPDPQAIEPDRSPGTPKGPPPPVKFRAKEKQWDVFEPDGRYLGRIRGPRELTLFVRRGNTVWGVVRDEDDVPGVVRMRIDPGM